MPEALAVAKVAGQITRSLDAELVAQRLAFEHNLPSVGLGELVLTSRKKANADYAQAEE